MSNLIHRRLDQLIIDAGLMDTAQMENLQQEKKKSSKRLSQLLLEKGLLSEEQFHSLLEEMLKIPRVNLAEYSIDDHLAQKIPPHLAFNRKVLPLKIKGRRLLLAMSDPLDLAAIDEVAMLSGFDILPVTAGKSAINHLLAQTYGSSGDQSDNAETERSSLVNENDDRAYTPEETPLIRMVDALIEKAIAEGASDIHLEQGADELRIRMRFDGILQDLPSPVKYKQAHIISRIKILANLDIAERRLPQDGNIEWQRGEQKVSMRVSTLPTVHGEKVVIRLLEKERIIHPLNQLGFSKDNHTSLMRLLLNQSGLLLLSGPTGSGKTTTLYSALNYLNKPQVNIITVEDPVELQMKGISQMQVNPRIGRTFAHSLRSILRQDPDIIMVGEIRDLETAKITTQAAMTGHLVLSTLHTNNAAAAITRLIDMGLEDYLVSASLVGVIAQRLVRLICSHCQIEYTLQSEEELFFRKFFGRKAPAKLKRGTGCRYCNNTGYRGRSSIQEVLVINQDLQELIMRGAKLEHLHKKAIQSGMQSLIDDGYRRITAGETTINELVRTTLSTVFDNNLTENMAKPAFLARLYREEV